MNMNFSHPRCLSLALLFTASLCALTQAGCGSSTTTSVAPTPTPANPGAQQILYLGNGFRSGTTSAFMINSDGSLTIAAGSPFSVGGVGVAANSAGKFVFLANSAALSSNSAVASGALSPVSSVADTSLMGGISVNPAGTTLYVASVNADQFNNGWRAYSIQANGTLQFVSGLINQAPGQLVFTADSLHAYNATCFHTAGNIEHFTIASTGTMTDTRQAVALIPSANNSVCPQAIAMDPPGAIIASSFNEINSLASANNQIALYTINPATRALTFITASPSPASGMGQDMKYDPSGKFIVMAQDTGLGVYKVGTNSVTEISGSPFSSGTNFTRLEFTPSGTFVVAISQISQQVSVFAFNSSTGALTKAPGSPLAVTGINLAMIQR